MHTGVMPKNPTISELTPRCGYPMHSMSQGTTARTGIAVTRVMQVVHAVRCELRSMRTLATRLEKRWVACAGEWPENGIRPCCLRGTGGEDWRDWHLFTTRTGQRRALCYGETVSVRVLPVRQDVAAMHRGPGVAVRSTPSCMQDAGHEDIRLGEAGEQPAQRSRRAWSSKRAETPQANRWGLQRRSLPPLLDFWGIPRLEGHQG